MNTAVFDLGGTWFRRGILAHDGSLTAGPTVPAVSFRSAPHLSKPALIDQCIAFVLAGVAQAETECQASIGAAAISLGAAINSVTGVVLDSGPLWGGGIEAFHPGARLSAARPDIDWHVFNDVSCLLYDHLFGIPPSARQRTLLITVSTGIAARLYDAATDSIPVDRTHGVQGEIGHLPVSGYFGKEAMARQCDCGADAHLNAFASGRGIEATMEELARGRLAAQEGQEDSPFVCALRDAQLPAARRFAAWTGALDGGDPVAQRLLDSATAPLAQVLLTILTHDPAIEQIVLTGGVVNALGARYVSSLDRQARAAGLYGVSHADPQFLARRLVLGRPDDGAGMRGAGRLAMQRRAAHGASGARP